MKKMILVIAALVLFAGCANVPSIDVDSSVSPTTGQSTANVQLFRASDYVQSRYGQTQLSINYEVRVKNIAYNKQVFVRHQLATGQWTNISLSYSRNADAGYEIWSGGYTEYNGFKMSNKFAVGYTVNGATYWDNNGGADYFLPHNGGIILGKGYNVIVERVNINNTQLWVNINVRNLAYNKTVKVVYTKDNWATSQVIYARFLPTFTIGYSTVLSPNAAGFEYWQAIADVGSTNNLKFFVEYQVNGQSSYDNNWGYNYGI